MSRKKIDRISTLGLADADVTGDLSVGGDTSMTGDLDVGGDVGITGSLTVDGSAVTPAPARTLTLSSTSASTVVLSVQYQEDGEDVAEQVFFMVYTTDDNTKQSDYSDKLSPPQRTPGERADDNYGLYKTAADGSLDVSFTQAMPGTSNEAIYVHLLGEATPVVHTLAFTM